MANLFESLAYFGQPWKWSKDEVKKRIEEDGIGSPFTGLRSGWSALKATEPVYNTLRGLKHLKEEGPKGLLTDLKEKSTNWKEAANDNWPVAAAMTGYGLFAGAGASAGAMGGLKGQAAQAGLGLLSQSQSQQPPAAPAVFGQPSTVDSSASRLRLLQEQQLQALRMKPDKTMEEWAQMQQLVKNQGLLGG